MASSFSSAPAGGAPPHDVLVRGYKTEIQQLKETLHELALRDTSAGSPGFNEVLEGKYLAQIKKNKTLSVQLGTAQQQLSDAQKALQVEQEKTKRLVAAATSLATNSKAGRRGGRPAKEASSNGHDDSDDDDGAKGTDSATAAVQRVYDQLHQKEIALAEVQRENTALRSLVQREVGLRDDTAEVDGLLRRTTAAAMISPVVESGGKSDGNSTTPTPQVGSTGWRGRAEEMVLLKSKLKDAQRRIEEMAAANSYNNDNADGSGAGHGSHSGADPLTLPASVRAYLGLTDDATSAAPSTATTTTRRRDVDDDARDRLTALQQQRAAQQRQQVADAEQLQRQLQEEKLRTAALQARVKTTRTELDTLRSYVETILDKSTTDDELMEAYKAEVRTAQAEVREWQKKAAEAATAAHPHRNPTSTDAPSPITGVRNGADAVMAAAAARSAPYRKATPADSSDNPAASSPVPSSPPPPQQQPLPMQNVDAVVYDWVLHACQESPALEKGQTTAEGAATPSSSAIAAVLRSALQHVTRVERQAAAASAVLRAGGLANDGASHADEGNGTTTAATAQLERVLVAENASLKKRIRALTDMMEREMQAQKVLWDAKDATGGK